jgi:ribose 5-phosphate isomerase B
MKVYFAADHAGFDLKNALVAYCKEISTAGVPYDAEDCGAFELDQADDYPDFIASAAKKLAEDAKEGTESRAVVIGASGQGEAMAANRFPGVRCALYYSAPALKQTDLSGHELDMLASSRAHNNANALSLGARFLSQDEAKAALKAWLVAPWSGEERHARRIKKLDALPGA